MRGALLAQLMKRQRTLQDVRSALDASAASFLEFAQSRVYKGDTYPQGIDKLYPLLSGYVGEDDVMGKAIEELKVKYTIRDADLAGRT